jgi:hypothetical protein
LVSDSSCVGEKGSVSRVASSLQQKRWSEALVVAAEKRWNEALVVAVDTRQSEAMVKSKKCGEYFGFTESH